jgi:cytochrome c-type biogenesis protein CcmH
VFVALGLIATVALGATLLYARMGRPDLAHRPDVATASDAAAVSHPGADVASMIDQLERRMAQSPGDPEGWRMLGWSYFQTGRYADAATAYGRAVALDPTNAEYLSAQGESLMRAAGGQITPGAVAVFRKAAAADPGDPRARYFLAAYKDQQGDHKGAMDDWIALLKSAPADAPWVPEVRAFVEQQAKDRGEDISGRLPPPGAPVQAAGPAPTAPGPNEDQVAAAAQMSGGDRQAMIAGMVDRLQAQLKASPRDEDGWVRLMRARMVLGQTAAASAAYRDAQQAFAGAPAEQAALRDAARGLSVPGA